MVVSGAYETRTHHLDTVSVENVIDYQIVIFKREQKSGTPSNYKDRDCDV